MIEMAGGTCVTADGGAQWMDYSLEELVRRDPQVLLVSTDAGKVEDLVKLNGYKSLSAVKNDRVYEINADIVSRPGPRIVDALEEIYDLLHK
jgi:iron complex transport system substrate-binding protein